MHINGGDSARTLDGCDERPFVCQRKANRMKANGGSPKDGNKRHVRDPKCIFQMLQRGFKKCVENASTSVARSGGRSGF